MSRAWRESVIKSLTEGDELNVTAKYYGFDHDMLKDPQEAVRRFQAFGFLEDEIYDVFPDIDKYQIHQWYKQHPDWLPQAVTYYTEGQTVSEIAEKVGKTRGAVYYHLDHLHLKPWSTHPDPLTEEDKEGIRAMANHDMSVAAISRLTGIRPTQISYYLKKRGKVF